MVATPTYTGELHHRYVDSLFAALVYSLAHGVQVELRIIAGASLIQYARNQLVREFLDDESFTHLLWIDADVGFDPRAIVRLLDHEKDAVGGVYPMKCIPLEWPYEALAGEQTTKLHRAKVMPGGFLLCSRHAVKTVADRAPRYWHYTGGMRYWTPHVFELVLEGGVLLGEDVIFSRRLQEAGFDVWCDPDLHFRHCGKFEWRGNLAQAIAQGATAAPPIAPQMIEALKAARSDEELGEALIDLHGAWGNSWAAPPFELLALARLVRRPGVRRVLETGCGISTLAMAAANPDAEVHALEHEPEWAARVEGEARLHGLTNVTIHRAPLSTVDWFYQIPAELPESFDLVFHDGPTFMQGAGIERFSDTRLPLYERLASRIENAVLVIDDCEHYAEQLEAYRHQVVLGRFAICLPRERSPGIVTSSAA